MSKHTPGPYAVTGITHAGSGVSPDRPSGTGYYVIHNGNGTVIAAVNNGPIADAYLLAAAPDLLAACEALIAAMKESEDGGSTDHLDCHDDGGKFWYDAIRDARSAIAKARGEVQP